MKPNVKGQPMAHRLADGSQVELGMRVVDYDRKRGYIEDSQRNRDELAKEHASTRYTADGVEVIFIGRNDDATYTCDAWFDVVRDDGGKSYMDCSRMIAEGGRLDRG